jgi:hypothetical protein
MAKILYRA